VSFRRIEEDGRYVPLIELDHGRWADGKYESPQNPKSEINVTDFAPGQIRDLDVALKYPNNDECYAVNNDNFG
jgi:hypothetical protein